MPHARLHDVSLYYEIRGDGPNLVLIEGLGYHTWMWYRQLPAFAPHFRTLIYDNRGVGRSDIPPGPYTHEQNAGDLEALLDHLGWERTHVLGVSMGGFIAQQFAVSYLDRVDRLVLVATGFACGPHMCAGYWRNPEATAEAIRAGWFHTGDIALRHDEGYYYIVDRKKDMIITGGENVYPAEVEAVLYAHPSVRETAVVGIPDPVWGEAVVAVVSVRPEHPISTDDLMAHVRANIARYKAPKRIVIVDELPKSALGKILRKECKALLEREKQGT
ncbi:MAG: alpha/beta fold hydrolase [Chloroflexota bacterium]